MLAIIMHPSCARAGPAKSCSMHDPLSDAYVAAPTGRSRCLRSGHSHKHHKSLGLDIDFAVIASK